jgi:MinD-like ATPase involved in chromosome partitioning or flagellar assembly
MDEDAGSRPPRTLADVSHLFFSRAKEGVEEPPGAEARPEADGCSNERAVAAPAAESDLGISAESDPGTAAQPVAEPDAAPGRTRIFVVTGGDDAPGKSTVAVNLAAALLPFGRVAVFDADPHVPNARYFLGLPSWHYLSPLTGNGPAPGIMTEGGVVVCDWSREGHDEIPGDDSVFYTDVPDRERRPLDFAVVDVPSSRTGLLSRLAPRVSMHIVVSRTGRLGFERAFAALRTLGRECGTDSVELVINGAASEDYAAGFHAKMRTAAERLLSMDVRLMGVVPAEPGLGAEQRERGAIVTSRPDAVSALSLRRVASNALQITRSDRRGSG